MGRQINLLSARKVQTLTAPGMYADGGGLYLRISAGKNSGKRWVFIYRRPGDRKRCEMGLGGVSTVSLQKARQKAAEIRAQLADGRDPLTTKNSDKRIPTFGELADKYIANMASSWRNPKHRAQWAMTLQVYAKPLRNKPVDQITTADVLAVLQPIWRAIPETASRLRGRIERVLDAAKVQGYRTGENPAAWRGHLKLILPARSKLSRGHHARMPIDEVPAFMARLRKRRSVAARCLEFTILTAVRSGEALGARWEEMDFERKLWTIPAHRMKSGVEHVVPLSEPALAVLVEMQAVREGEYVFPGQRCGKPLSNMALEMVLRRMGIQNATVHGFRSCFRDWAGDRTSFPRELAEHALAHAIGDLSERAYRREAAVERRRPLMEAWASYLDGSNLCVDLSSATPDSVQLIRG